jgi:hypothetical protein
VSGTIILLILGCSAQWGYFRHLNSHPMDFWRISSLDGLRSVTVGARTLLVITSILDAARNSTSLFLLLIVSMGYGVVRPSIGPVMTRVRILTGVHFLCGVLYSVSLQVVSHIALYLTPSSSDRYCAHPYRIRRWLDFPLHFSFGIYPYNLHDVDVTLAQCYD